MARLSSRQPREHGRQCHVRTGREQLSSVRLMSYDRRQCPAISGGH